MSRYGNQPRQAVPPAPPAPSASKDAWWRSDNVHMLAASTAGAVLFGAWSYFLAQPVRVPLVLDPLGLSQHADDRGEVDATAAPEQRRPPSPAENRANYRLNMSRDRDDRGEVDAGAPEQRLWPLPGAGHETSNDRAGNADGLHRDRQGRPYLRWRECTGSRKHPRCGPWQPGPAPGEE
jgi:hypothetical protein